jgi:Kef-type K+ transport system membrane component KefB
LDNAWLIAALWVGLALAASLISIRLGISVALIEIMLGMIGGNFLGLAELPWVTFVAGFGAIFLTFLAGAEVDPYVLKNKFKESFAIGFLSFLLPFLAAFAYAYYVIGWDLDASLICGIALSTTSVAVHHPRSGPRIFRFSVHFGLPTALLFYILFADKTSTPLNPKSEDLTPSTDSAHHSV